MRAKYLREVNGFLRLKGQELRHEDKARAIYFYLSGLSIEQAGRELERGFIISQEEEHFVELLKAMGETSSEQRATLRGYLIAHNERTGRLEELLTEYEGENLREAQEWAEELELLKERESKLLRLSQEAERAPIEL